MTSSSEHERIAALARLFGAAPPNVLVGVGDDAAVLTPPAGALVWSIDAAVEGVHFSRDLMSLEDAGYRATMAALSDLAAMGARPIGVLAALTLASGTSDEELFTIARGQLLATRALGTAVIGGNLARGDALTITTTVLGSAERPVRRDAARAGDVIVIAGPVGLAAAGFALASRDSNETASDDIALALASFRRPTALCDAGEAAVRAGATAMIDVSDGLAADVSHLGRQSGVTVELRSAALVTPALYEVARLLGKDPLELALTGGEDYALVAALPIAGVAAAVRAGFREVGQCVAHTGRHVVILGASGEELHPRLEGYDHFSRA